MRERSRQYDDAFLLVGIGDALLLTCNSSTLLAVDDSAARLHPESLVRTVLWCVLGLAFATNGIVYGHLGDTSDLFFNAIMSLLIVSSLLRPSPSLRWAQWMSWTVIAVVLGALAYKIGIALRPR